MAFGRKEKPEDGFNETPLEKEVREMLNTVYDALEFKGYHPLNQIWLYLMTGDETYITTYNHARELITAYDHEEVGRCVLAAYLRR